MTRYYVHMRSREGREQTASFDSATARALWTLEALALGCRVVREWVAL